MTSPRDNIYRINGELGYLISSTANDQVAIKIKKTVYNKQKRPYSDCDFEVDLDGNYKFPSEFDRKYYDQIIQAGYEYSKSMCISFCQLDRIGNNCTLRASNINAPNNVDNFCPDNNLNFLNSFTLLSNWIEDYFFNQKIDSECAKKCPTECLDERFDLIITPRNLYPSVTKDILGLYINYESLSYLNYEESPSISVYNLVSNIGGAIGLLLGIFGLYLK